MYGPLKSTKPHLVEARLIKIDEFELVYVHSLVRFTILNNWFLCNSKFFATHWLFYDLNFRPKIIRIRERALLNENSIYGGDQTKNLNYWAFRIIKLWFNKLWTVSPYFSDTFMVIQNLFSAKMGASDGKALSKEFFLCTQVRVIFLCFDIYVESVMFFVSPK